MFVRVFACVCLCAHTHAHMYVYMCARMGGPEVDIKNLPILLLHLFVFEAGSLTWPGAP